jgi:hypothetical protein
MERGKRERNRGKKSIEGHTELVKFEIDQTLIFLTFRVAVLSYVAWRESAGQRK